MTFLRSNKWQINPIKDKPSIKHQSNTVPIFSAFTLLVWVFHFPHVFRDSWQLVVILEKKAI